MATEIRNRCLESHKIFASVINKISGSGMDEESEADELYDQEEIFTEHEEEIVEEPRQNRCCLCSSVFEFFEEISLHCLEAHSTEIAEDKEENYCMVCENFFGTHDLLLNHRTCEICSELCEDEAELVTHRRQCHEALEVVEFLEAPEVEVPTTSSSVRRTKKFGCCQCSTASDQKIALKNHFFEQHSAVYCHEPKTGFACFLCNQSFETREDMLQHLRAPRLQVYPCDLCREVFSAAGKLQKHKDSVHVGQTGESYGCNQCEKVYEKLTSLNHHKYIMHNKSVVFHCDICNRDFHRKTFFTEHMNAHKGIKPYFCEVCNASFARKNNLRQHTRVHSGERPYKCPVCPKSYMFTTDLRRHSYNHTKNFPLSCEICKKGFGKKSSLDLHLKTHSTEPTVDIKLKLFPWLKNSKN